MKKIPAHIISIITHPILMMSIGLLLCIKLDPYSFGVYDWTLRWPVVAMIAMMTFVFPLVVVFMLKKLGFIESFEMNTTKERIIPYIATSIFYLWLYITTRSNPEISSLFKSYTLGAIIIIFIIFFINNFYKISAHMAGLGGLAMMTIFIGLQISGTETWGIVAAPQYLPSLVLLVGGLAAGARLDLGAHRWHELASGFVVGIVGILVGYQIYF